MKKLAPRLSVRHITPSEPNRQEILAKAMSALREQRITAHDAVRCEVFLNSNRLPDQATLEKIFAQLAVEVDAGAIAREITELIHA